MELVNAEVSPRLIEKARARYPDEVFVKTDAGIAPVPRRGVRLRPLAGNARARARPAGVPAGAGPRAQAGREARAELPARHGRAAAANLRAVPPQSRRRAAPLPCRRARSRACWPRPDWNSSATSPRFSSPSARGCSGGSIRWSSGMLAGTPLGELGIRQFFVCRRPRGAGPVAGARCAR